MLVLLSVQLKFPREALSDSRSSLQRWASITIIAKEWLRRDFGDDDSFLDGVSIH